MNRAEKRRQKKLSAKQAKSAKSAQPTGVGPQLVNQAVQHHAAGELAEAERLYRLILQTEPKHAVALQFLGVISHQQGNSDVAVELIRKAIALKPDYTEAHNNLGLVYKNQGKLEDAIASYRNAIALNPSHADSHYNLGIVLNGMGNLEEAANSYQRAIAAKPDFAAAYYNLGSTFFVDGKLDEAIAIYNKLLSISPDYAEAHSNLGNVLFQQGRLDDAVAAYTRALSIRPDYADAHYNLGIALLEQGRDFDAFQSHRRGARLTPQNADTWAGMLQSLTNLSFEVIDDHLLADLQSLAEQPNVSPWQIVGPALSALRCDPGFARIIAQATATSADPDRSGGTIAVPLSSFPLFLTLIRMCPMNDLEIERMLMVLRRALLHEAIASSLDPAGLPFVAALAQHCFTNEYIYVESEQDTAAVDRLEQRIASYIAAGEAVPPLELAILATFRPLHRCACAAALAGLDGGPEIAALIKQQISEPLEEADLRPQIPQLTPIRNSVSQSVRAQYEESPYPRWINTKQIRQARTIESELQKPPYHFDLGDFKSPAAPAILIAGCGTGQHSLNTASKFLGARVRAIDLSLSSLAYARRKTRELGVTNIDYAQADIMELGGLEQRFDLIESAGVLHHMADPLAGWRVLVGLLRPHGLMRIALYSETARQTVVEGRRLIAKLGYTTSPEDIRRCRQDLITRVAGGETQFAKALQFRDFYSLSECRDLLFHVQEHRFTVPQIEAALSELNLRFLGFEIDDKAILDAFQKANPDATARTSLARWHAFETDNPDIFRSMYVFWCQKA